MFEVIIVGGGPTGLLLAAELALADVDVVVLERRETHQHVESRARGFHARTVELLDQRGVAGRFLEEAVTVSTLSFAGVPLDLAALPTRHPYLVGLAQERVERILLGWVEELGVPVRRGVTVTGFAQDEAGVEVQLAEGAPVRAGFLVGADGGRSVVRRTAGIRFEGAPATRSHLIAEVKVTEPPPTGMRVDDLGVQAITKVDEVTVGMVVTERELGPTANPTLRELRDALATVYGTDFGAHDPRWISRFTDTTRQANIYRNGRVLIAGDAAHVHPPTGGQGISLGAQDAVNLGWKLAQVVHGHSGEDLLDSYRHERHPATARVLNNVMTQASLQRGDARTAAMIETFADLLFFEAPRTHLAGLLSGLDVRHDLGAGHALLGRRMPDLEIRTQAGPRRIYQLLHGARSILLDLGTQLEIDIVGWEDRVLHVRGAYDAPWELPVVGTVTAPRALLVRPDGHVAWVDADAHVDDTALVAAMTKWCGEPNTSNTGRT